MQHIRSMGLLSLVFAVSCGPPNNTTEPLHIETVCGDGEPEGQEVCDDGNTDDTDACRSDCLEASCGDGVVRTDLLADEEGYEACDAGQANSDSEPNQCREDCTLPRCGDGVVDEGEECDAGDTGDVGECTDDCRAVSGIRCTTHSQCPGSLFCRDYRCVECLRSRDCAADEVCRNGACVQRED